MTEQKMFLPTKLITLLPGLPDKELSVECLLGSFLCMVDTDKYDFKELTQDKLNGIYKRIKKLPNTTHAIFSDTFNKYLSSSFEKNFIKYVHPKEQPKNLSEFMTAYKELKITDLELTRYFDSVIEADISDKKNSSDNETGLERLNYEVSKLAEDGTLEYSMKLALVSSEDTIKRTNKFLKDVANSSYVNTYFVSNICGYILRSAGVFTQAEFDRVMTEDLADINGKGSAALISSAVVSNFVINNFRELGKSFF